MMAIAFLGYQHSPKWFNKSISWIIFLIIVYYTILVRKSNLGSSVKNTQFNCKLNRKAIQHLNNLNRRKYSTNSSTPGTSCNSERLISIIKELGVNPVYTFENLVSEDIRKQMY